MYMYSTSKYITGSRGVQWCCSALQWDQPLECVPLQIVHVLYDKVKTTAPKLSLRVLLVFSLPS